MDIDVKFDCSGVDWKLVASTLKEVGMGHHEPKLHRKAFENSFVSVFIYQDNRLIGFGRAISDSAYQAAVYLVIMMKTKKLLIALLSLGLAACTQEHKAVTPVTNEKTETLGYELVTKKFVDPEKNITIQYPEMKGYRGEVLQDYMNQSLAKILELYGQNENYSDVTITYEITRMDKDVCSVVFRGKGLFSGSKEFSILKSMNLDTGKSSNEINYGNFVANDAELRKLIGKKAVEQGLVEFFEAEGINLYFKDDTAVFYYMPLDDMADTFIEVPISLDVIEGYINWDFGDMPGS